MKTTYRFSKKEILAFLILLGISINPANAVTLTPGAFTPLPGTTVATESQLAGTVIVDDLVNFSFAANGGTILGAVQVRIVEAIDSTLDFYWRVFNNPDSDGSIGSFRIGDFFTSDYNANYRIDGLGDDAPDRALLFTGAFEGYLNFQFDDGGLAAGDSSNFFFLDTDATEYAKTAKYDLTNIGQTNISGIFSTYAPVNNVPAPASLVLLSLGLISLGLRKRTQNLV